MHSKSINDKVMRNNVIQKDSKGLSSVEASRLHAHLEIQKLLLRGGGAVADSTKAFGNP